MKECHLVSLVQHMIGDALGVWGGSRLELECIRHYTLFSVALSTLRSLRPPHCIPHTLLWYYSGSSGSSRFGVYKSVDNYHAVISTLFHTYFRLASGTGSPPNDGRTRPDKMNQRTYLRNALQAGEPGIGMWLTIPGASTAKTVATVPGFNWILIDAEHGQIVDSDFFVVSLRRLFAPLRDPQQSGHMNHHSDSQLNNLITQEGVSPIIRVPADEAWLLKRALDSGAHGVMVPMCHDAVSRLPSRFIQVQLKIGLSSPPAPTAATAA